MSINKEMPQLDDITKAARHLADAFGRGAAREARCRASNAALGGSSAAEVRWERIARLLDGVIS